MKNKGQLAIGVFIIFVGITILVRTLTGIHLWSYIWPALLIALGIWLIARPHTHRQFCLFGDIRRRGPWTVTDEELWCLIGDVVLDFSEAEVPAGETRIRVYGLVGDMKVILTPSVGVAITSPSLITSARIEGFKQDYLFTPYDFTSEGYAASERRVHLTISRLINDLRIN